METTAPISSRLVPNAATIRDQDSSTKGFLHFDLGNRAGSWLVPKMKKK